MAWVGDFRSVVEKGNFRTGDLAVYIPEGTICPEEVIAHLGLDGKLSGPDQNRVHPVRLRGILSQGLIYPMDSQNKGEGANGGMIGPHFLKEGSDAADLLGLVKHEPPIPENMQGEIENAFGCTLHYDIEDIKKYPDVLQESDEVIITEKLHGTWCCLGIHPEFGPIVTSKHLSAQGLVFKLGEENKNNIYVQTWEKHKDIVQEIAQGMLPAAGQSKQRPVYIMGEIFGPKVQDLNYGLKELGFRAFDIYVGKPYALDSHEGSFLDNNALRQYESRLPLVPMLYQGPFDREILKVHTEGTSILDPRQRREGCVIRPKYEREDRKLGRVVLKSLSEKHLLRKGGTEYQ